METPKPMQGPWTLKRPDGKFYVADSPIACLRAEQAERVPAQVAVQRIMAEVAYPHHERTATMYQRAPNIPGQPHRWSEVIAAWAHGKLVQWRYASPEATDADWQDCTYPSAGRPNFEHEAFEFRIAR